MDANDRQSVGLVDIQGLSTAIGLPVRTIRTLVSNHKVPVMRLGHRTIRFSTDRVMAALQKLEVKAAGQ